MTRLLMSFALLALIASHSVSADDVVGPVVGTVESTTAELLYRPAATATPMRLTVIDATGTAVRSVEADSKQESDFVAKFSVEGLSPDTSYRYRIDQSGVSGKNLVAADEQHSFTTANPSRSGHRVTVGFVSCVDIEPNGIWKDMNKVGVDTLCLMGDTPYIDNVDLGVVRSRQRKFLQMPDLAALAAHTPTIGIWDDHDFGANNGNGLSVMQGKVNTRRGFVDYRAHSQYGNGSEGVYHKVDLGMMEVFLLDPRYFSQTEKSPVDSEQPTCFGADQWKWLLANLRASKAAFKVLAMGAIWEDKKNSETDDLFTYWYERDALLNIIKNENIGGVVLLGGDIHVARHLIHPQRVGYDLHDFVISPGHTRTITELDVYHPSLEWSLVEGWQYLTLMADGTGDVPKLVAEFRQPDRVNRKVVLSLDELTQDFDSSSSPTLRAHWTFDGDTKNHSILGSRIDAQAVNGAAIAKDAGIQGDAVLLDASAQQYLTVPRSFLDDNSADHTVSMWMKPSSLPKHGSTERSFLLESTAEGKPSNQQAFHLSLGFRAAGSADKINLQLFTRTLKPATKPQAAPVAISQGPFDTLIDRQQLLEKWNHVAFTFDSKQIRLYLNGNELGRYPLPVAGPAAEFGGLIIGGHRAGEGRNFDGYIDEVRIYQGLLGEEEMKAEAATDN